MQQEHGMGYLNKMGPNRLRYYLLKLKINQKYSRTQKISWVDQKKILFSIMSELNRNNLFSNNDKKKAQYNIVSNYHEDKSKSICLLPLNKDLLLVKSSHFDTKKGVGQDLTEQNYAINSNLYLFQLGLIRHSDISIFNEGEKKSVWEYVKGEDSGLLFDTHLGILADDLSKEIILVKQSGGDTVGLTALYHYLEEKSETYRDAMSTDSKINITTFPKQLGQQFDIKDIKNLTELIVTVDGTEIEKYRRMAGDQDAFFGMLSDLLPRGFKSKSMQVKIRFIEEGNTKAVRYLQEFHSGFQSDLHEVSENVIENFKISYESKTAAGERKINFKRRPKAFYEVEVAEGVHIDHFKHIKDAMMDSGQ